VRIGTILLAAAALASTAGCGSPSKKEYIKSGDAICRATNVEAAKRPVPDKADVRGTADYLRETSRLLKDQVDRLDALDAPERDEPRLRDVWRRQREALDQLKKAADQFQLADPVNAQATANNANTALLEIRQDLQGYGFADCGNQ
jgi:hypothetical protein